MQPACAAGKKKDGSISVYATPGLLKYPIFE